MQRDLPRLPTLAALLAALAACPGPRAVAPPDADVAAIAAAPDDAPNLRIELGDGPGGAPGPVVATDGDGGPARLVEAWPRWIAARDPVLVLHFDRRVDAAAVLPALRVEVEGGAPPLRLATPAERARPEVQAQLAGLDPARTATFAFTAPLPLRAGVEVSMTDVPALDGPLRSRDRDSFSFSVHDGLRVLGVGCSSGPVCRPGAALVVRFSAHLRERPAPRVRVDPPLDGVVEVSGTELYLNGATRAHQIYAVTIPADFEDMYGQSLGEARTFRVRIAGPEPSFDITGGMGARTLLAPDAPRALTARTIDVHGLQVVVYAVRPVDWQRHVESMYDEPRAPTTARLGLPAISGVVAVTGAGGQVVETTIDLAAALPGGLGQAIVDVRPVDWPDAEAPRARMWLQATRIGVDAVVDATSALVWTTDLQTGAPLPGVRVELGAATARSDADGLARLALPATRIPVLTATLGADVAMLADGGGEGFVRSASAPLLLPVVVTDRDAYRPGDTVQVRGWLRRWTRGPRGDLEPAPVRALTYTLVDAASGERGSGSVAIESVGDFAFTLTLPTALEPGAARLVFAAGDERFFHDLRVTDPARSTVSVRGDAGPHVVGGHADLIASAQTAAGDPEAGAAVQWTVQQRPARFTPPGHDDFRFGRPRDAPAASPAVHHAYADARGQHRLRARFTALAIREPTTVIAGASTRALDVPAAVTLLVHPASVYVGLRSASRFVAAGEPLVVDAIVVDIAGERVAGRPIVVRGHAVTADGARGRAIGACHLRSAREPVRCALAPQAAGPYAFAAIVVDEQGRAQDSELALWAAGEPAARRPAGDALRVVPDRDRHRVGETARVLVLAPFAPAEGLWTLRRDGVLASGRFRAHGTSTILDIPIAEAMAPGAVLHVQLVGQQPRSRTDARLRPAHAEGAARLAVAHPGRSLDLSFEPASATLEPGARGRLDVIVRDADARPVAGAAVTVVVVDEDSPALARLTDLFAGLDVDPGTGTTDHHSRHDLAGIAPAAGPAFPFAPSVRGGPVRGGRGDVTVVDLAPTAGHIGSRVRLDGVPDPRPAAPVALDSADTLAVFAAATTDANGRARVSFTAPGDRPRYRVLAYATAGARSFGAAQTSASRR